MATSSGCFRTDKCRPPLPRSASSQHRASAHPGHDRAVSEKPPRRLPSMRVVPIKTHQGRKPAMKDRQKSAKSTTVTEKRSVGFTDAERAAMKARARELKAEERAS